MHIQTVINCIYTRDISGTRFSRVPKKFPVTGKKNSLTGKFREIAYNPSLQNFVATVRKSMDAAQRTGGVRWAASFRSQ